MIRSTIVAYRGFMAFCILAAMLAAASTASGDPVKMGAAPDFPPGSFSDGGHYKLADFDGKVLVLFFYEQDCPTCRGLIPARNKVVDQFKDKPVKFIAVGPGDTLSDTIAYTRDTRLKMPSFSDVFGVMQGRYGFSISLQNIYQFRIIGPKGDIVGASMEPADIERALQGVTWKYKDGGYDDSLKPVLDLLEWNQYAPALQRLRPLTKGGNKTVAESANKLMDAVKVEGKAWLADAAKAADTEPVAAYDLYRKVSSDFANDELGKEADAALKSLAKNPAITEELAARGMYDRLSVASARAQAAQKPAFIGQAKSIAAKYPNSPTGKKAGELAEELQGSTTR